MWKFWQILSSAVAVWRKNMAATASFYLKENNLEHHYIIVHVWQLYEDLIWPEAKSDAWYRVFIDSFTTAISYQVSFSFWQMTGAVCQSWRQKERMRRREINPRNCFLEGFVWTFKMLRGRLRSFRRNLGICYQSAAERTHFYQLNICFCAGLYVSLPLLYGQVRLIGEEIIIIGLIIFWLDHF